MVSKVCSPSCIPKIGPQRLAAVMRSTEIHGDVQPPHISPGRCRKLDVARATADSPRSVSTSSFFLSWISKELRGGMLLLFSPTLKCAAVCPSLQPNGGGLQFFLLCICKPGYLPQAWSFQSLTCDFFKNETMSQQLLGMILQSLLFWLYFNLACSNTADSLAFQSSRYRVLNKAKSLTQYLRNKIQRCLFLWFHFLSFPTMNTIHLSLNNG